MKRPLIDQADYITLLSTLTADAQLLGIKDDYHETDNTSDQADVLAAVDRTFAKVAATRLERGMPPIDLSAWGYSAGLDAASLRTFVAKICPTAAQPVNAARLPTPSEAVEQRLVAQETHCPFPAGSLSAECWHKNKARILAAAASEPAGECPFTPGSISAKCWHAKRDERAASAQLQATIDPIVNDASIPLGERQKRVAAMIAAAS